MAARQQRRHRVRGWHGRCRDHLGEGHDPGLVGPRVPFVCGDQKELFPGIKREACSPDAVQGRTPRRKEGAVGRELLDPFGEAVSDVHVPVTVDGQGLRSQEVARPGSGPSPHRERAPIRCEALHPAIPDLGHQDGAVGVDRKCRRIAELSRTTSPLAPIGYPSIRCRHGDAVVFAFPDGKRPSPPVPHRHHFRDGHATRDALPHRDRCVRRSIRCRRCPGLTNRECETEGGQHQRLQLHLHECSIERLQNGANVMKPSWPAPRSGCQRRGRSISTRTAG